IELKRSTYMEWAKLRSTSRFNLATSGMLAYPMSELDVRQEDMDLTGSHDYGFKPLVHALATKSGVPAECVVTVMGTSFANHLAMAAILNRGDDVLIEHPGYDPLTAVARYLGASVSRFYRRPEHGFGIDVSELQRALTPRTRLIVLTN